MDPLEEYLPLFQNHWSRIQIPYESQYACAIVEPRCHPHLELVIKNVLYFVSESFTSNNWALYVFHSAENEEFVKSIVGQDKLKDVHLICTCQSNLSLRDYNLLMVSETFWSQFSADFVLLFQTDSYLRKHGIMEFVQDQVAMVGAPWSPEFTHSSVSGSDTQAGNGGLSLRNKSKILEALKFSKSHYPFMENWNEDMFYHVILQHMGQKLAHVDRAKQFSVEAVYYHDPLGVHKFWNYIKQASHSLFQIKLFPEDDNFNPFVNAMDKV